MLLKLAWRNIWRNKRRTVITTLAMTLGVAGIIGLHSYQQATYKEMTLALTRGMVGHLQVMGRGYQVAPEITTLVAAPEAVERAIEKILPAATVEKRVLGAALAGAGESSAGVAVFGVEPGNEHAGTLITMDSGRMPAAGAMKEVVVARGLAKELGVAAGSELVLFGQAADGSLANDRYTVVGVADAGSYDANAATVFLPLAEAQSFFSLGAGVHQIIVRLPGKDVDAEAAAALIRPALPATDLEALAWSEILPELKATMEQKGRQMYGVDFIIFLIIALGVLNTMTMSTFERTREFGVMASLGTRRSRILSLVVTETIMQGVIAFALGLLVAWAILTAIGPIDLTKVADSDVLGVRMPNNLVLRVHPTSVMAAAATSLLTMLAGGFFPAYRASRLKPADAARYV